MTRVMLDSTAAVDIPTSAEMVAGYLPPSQFAWSAADWARFPHAVKVRIAVRATVNDGHVLDVETGDATPAQAPGWVLMRRQAGADPSVYCSASAWPTVRAAFTAAGVAQPHYWIAAYPGGGPVIPAGAVAHQWADETITGHHYDQSVVADFWPGVDQQEAQMEQTDAVNDAPWVGGKPSIGHVLLNVWENNTGANSPAAIMAQLRAISGALSADEAALLAAVKAVTQPGQAVVSAADLETALRNVLGAGFDVTVTPKAAP